MELQNIVAVLWEAQGEKPVVFAASESAHAGENIDKSAIQITGFTLYTLWKMPRSLFQVAALIWRTKPTHVISTGGAPGVLAIILGRLRGAHCIWVDSLYNSQEISLSGRIAGVFAQTWLTQWKHLAEDSGPFYRGALL